MNLVFRNQMISEPEKSDQHLLLQTYLVTVNTLKFNRGSNDVKNQLPFYSDGHEK